MPQNLAFIGAENNHVLLVITGNEQIARSYKDAWAYCGCRIVQVRIRVPPRGVSSEGIDRLQYSHGAPNANAGSSVT